jgi:hypothetical protein
MAKPMCSSTTCFGFKHQAGYGVWCAPQQGNMTQARMEAIDGTSMRRMERLIADLKAGRYTLPVRRKYIQPMENASIGHSML